MVAVQDGVSCTARPYELIHSWSIPKRPWTNDVRQWGNPQSLLQTDPPRLSAGEGRLAFISCCNPLIDELRDSNRLVKCYSQELVNRAASSNHSDQDLRRRWAELTRWAILWAGIGACFSSWVVVIITFFMQWLPSQVVPSGHFTHLSFKMNSPSLHVNFAPELLVFWASSCALISSVTGGTIILQCDPFQEEPSGHFKHIPSR